MTQVMQTTRDLPVEVHTLEPFLGFGTDGKPQYGSPVPFIGHFVEYDVDARRGTSVVFAPGGQQIEIILTVYVVGDAAIHGNEQDRITRNGIRYVIMRKIVVAGLGYLASEPDHVRLRCAREDLL